MAEYKNAMEVFKMLNKSNCKDCNRPTCLAFAAAVFQGQASLNECPHIDVDTLTTSSLRNSGYESKFEQDYLEEMAKLTKRVKTIDLEGRAGLLGGQFRNNKLTLKILGKDFSVDQQGNISTILHVNSWLAPPVLNYILESQGLPLTHNWVSFRDLSTSKDWTRFFEHQTVGLIKKVADTSPSFFEDIIELFSGERADNHYEADISLIIKPLPLLPILFCYNNPEDGMDSDLHLFFDSTADKNLPVKNIYTLTTGLGHMFEKLASIHG